MKIVAIGVGRDDPAMYYYEAEDYFDCDKDFYKEFLEKYPEKVDAYRKKYMHIGNDVPLSRVVMCMSDELKDYVVMEYGLVPTDIVDEIYFG